MSNENDPHGDPEVEASLTTSSSQASASSAQGKRRAEMRLPPFTSMTPARRTRDGQEDSDDDEAYFAASSAPMTPNISEAAQQLRRSLSVHGLHELSHMPPDQLRKSVSNKVWRPQDEALRLPGDWERLAVHVFRGGVRAFNLSFGLRATVMLLLELIKGLRKRKLKGKDVGKAIFSLPNLRFGIMFGIWAALYKSVHNSLRLITPIPSKRPARSQSQPPSLQDATSESTASLPVPISTHVTPHSMSTDATPSAPGSNGTSTPRSGYAELQGKTEEEKTKVKSKQKQKAFMRDPRSKVWHAYVAGAVSALAVMVETKDNRISLAQQLFVRGLEGSYNVAHEKKYIRIPHGAVLAFGLACGQIMWAWLNAPETLPKGYVNWITNASMVAPNATPLHRSIHQKGTVDTDWLVKKWLDGRELPSALPSGRYPALPPGKGSRRGFTSVNTKRFVEWVRGIEAGSSPGAFIPCHAVHPWEHSHWWSPIDRFVEVTRWILPVYMTLHFVPAVFLRTGAFLRNPVKVFSRSLFGSVRSSSFLGVFVIIFQTIFCAAHSLHTRILASKYLTSITPKWFLDFLAGSTLHWFAGFLTCGSLFIDHSRRRAELAAYVLPKGLESMWSILRKTGWAPFVPGGDLLLTSLGMSLVMGTYARSPEHLSGLVRRVVYQFIGRN
ncbi:unnamed protein product [Sympodiomycopsis kandeliae]